MMFPDERFQGLMDHLPLLIWRADVQGRWVYVNQRWTEFTGRALDPHSAFAWLEMVHPDDAPRLRGQIAGHLARREPFQVEFRMLRHDGRWRTMQCSGRPWSEIGGAFAGFVGYCMDETLTREAEAQRRHDMEERAAMLQELHHRVKNNAQVFASLLSVQASRAHDPAVKAGLRAAAARASTIAMAQQQIWDAGSSARFDLCALVRRVARAQQARGVQITVEAPPTLFVPLATAVPFELIIHELLTNATTHAVPEAGLDNLVRITLRRDASNHVALEVADNGRSDGEDACRSPQAGLTIVRSLVRQLGATWSTEWDGGTRVRVALSGQASDCAKVAERA